MMLSVSVVGCSELAQRGKSGPSESDIIEVIVDNLSESSMGIAVRILGDESEVLFSDAYRIKSMHRRSEGEILETPDEIHVFTEDGRTKSWDYVPSSQLQCENKDVGIEVGEDYIAEFYSC